MVSSTHLEVDVSIVSAEIREDVAEGDIEVRDAVLVHEHQSLWRAIEDFSLLISE